MSFPAWTDYPILRMGDVSGKPAPVRKCTVLSYDGNKYCRVKVSRYVEEIKAGYIYSRVGRCGDVPAVSIRKLRTVQVKP